VTIIDAGLPRYLKLLNSELARIGLTLDDVRALILTHGDGGHVGLLSWTRCLRGPVLDPALSASQPAQ